MAKIYSIVAFDPPLSEATRSPYDRNSWCETFALTLDEAIEEASAWRNEHGWRVYIREADSEQMLGEIVDALNEDGPPRASYLPPPITPRGAVMEEHSDSLPTGEVSLESCISVPKGPPGSGFVNRCYPDVLNTWTELTDTARTAGIILYSELRVGDVFVVDHRQLVAHLPCETECASRRAFRCLLRHGLLERVSADRYRLLDAQKT